MRFATYGESGCPLLLSKVITVLDISIGSRKNAKNAIAKGLHAIFTLIISTFLTCMNNLFKMISRRKTSICIFSSYLRWIYLDYLISMQYNYLFLAPYRQNCLSADVFIFCMHFLIKWINRRNLNIWIL